MPAPPPTAKPYCPNCKATYERGSLFCAEDGTRLNAPENDPNQLDARLRPPEPHLQARPGFDLCRPQASAADSSSNQGGLEQWLIAGRYLKLRTLGNGGQGAVMLVQDIQTGRVMALKLFRPETDIAWCRREVEAAARIEDHRHIVKIYDLHRDGANGVPFITMQYIEGESLESALDREELVLQDSISLLRQVSSGLSEMHSKMLVHRDVKPANIMLCRQSGQVQAKLLDLGITKSLNPGANVLTQPGWVIGTLDYASPEQLRGEPVTPLFDVYSLGVVAHRLLEGRMPTESQVVRKRPDAHVPGELRSIVRRMIHEDPAMRPQSMQEVTLALESADRSFQRSNPVAVVEREQVAPTPDKLRLASRSREPRDKRPERNKKRDIEVVDLDANKTLIALQNRLTRRPAQRRLSIALAVAAALVSFLTSAPRAADITEAASDLLGRALEDVQVAIDEPASGGDACSPAGIDAATGQRC